MPLLDHFRPPLSPFRSWQAFFSGWTTMLAGQLNRILPPDNWAELDLGCYKTPPFAEVCVFHLTGESALDPLLGRTAEVIRYGEVVLVGSVIFVCPRNKDTAANRAALAARCEARLRARVGVVVVDVVTDPATDVCGELFGGGPGGGTGLGATAACPADDPAGRHGTAIWVEPVALGAALPSLPLRLRGGRTVPVDLDEAYEAAIAGLRIPTA